MRRAAELTRGFGSNLRDLERAAHGAAGGLNILGTRIDPGKLLAWGRVGLRFTAQSISQGAPYTTPSGPPSISTRLLGTLMPLRDFPNSNWPQSTSCFAKCPPTHESDFGQS